jgi:hypothetical protein
VEGCGRMWKDVEGCGRMWKDVEGCGSGRMWEGVGEISADKKLRFLVGNRPQTRHLCDYSMIGTHKIQMSPDRSSFFFIVLVGHHKNNGKWNKRNNMLLMFFN